MNDWTGSGKMRVNETATCQQIGSELTRPRSATVLMSDLARDWPNLPPDAQPIASNAIEICKKWDQCRDPKRLLGKQLVELKKRMALTAN